MGTDIVKLNFKIFNVTYVGCRNIS